MADRQRDHLPGLDGIRAISIILVLLGHLGGTHGFARIELGIGDYSNLGVTVFFVVSGFLITLLLLAEHKRNGTIALNRFYLRRAIRLFPAAYTYIACIGLLSLWGILDVSLPNMWHAATYTVNHMQHPQWEIGHLWSLSLEEQFYLIWPLVFLAIGPPKAIWAALALIALGPIARTSGWLYEVLHGSTYHDYKMFPMLSDTLAMGCLLACLKDWLESKPLYLRLFHPAWSLTVLALVLAVNRYSYRAIVSVPGTLFISLGIALLIHRSVYCPSDWIGKLLNNRILSFTGILSYSLYIWQQPFLNRYANYWASAFPQNIIFTIAAALASYFLLEKPLLQMRRRLRS